MNWHNGIYNLLDELKEQQDKTYILVAHNGIARVVQSYFKDMTNEEYAAFGVQNCSVTEFLFEDKKEHANENSAGSSWIL